MPIVNTELSAGQVLSAQLLSSQIISTTPGVKIYNAMRSSSSMTRTAGLKKVPERPPNPNLEPNQSPRILYLTRDPDLIRRQIAGTQLVNVAPEELLDRISTDTITPARFCATYTGEEDLGQVLLVDIPGRLIRHGDITGKFDIIVAGESFGKGSSREHCQLALKQAGITTVIARSTERIFRDNCTNYGINALDLTSAASQKLLSGTGANQAELTANLSPISRDIFRSGGLIPYLIARLEGRVSLPEIATPQRAMTIAEKIIALHAVKNNGKIGISSVKPGDELFIQIDKGYAYEVQSIISKAVLEREAPGFQVPEPERFYFFEDHSALFAGSESAAIQRRLQRDLVSTIPGSKLYGIDAEEGVEGICHTVMLEKHTRPGDVVMGNDSHTVHLGAANALAIPKGASDMAGAFLTGDVLSTVPETIRVNLRGELPPNVTSKDLMLYILSLQPVKNGFTRSKVLEYGGPALDQMPFDDQSVLTNMTSEANGFTGIISPNEMLASFMMQKHNLTRQEVEQIFVYSDSNAQYANAQLDDDPFDIDLSTIEPMIATPGDPQNGVPISQIGDIPVNIAYIGSCTGGKLKDLEDVAAVLKGKKVAPGVKLYVQASSQTTRAEAQKRGLIEIFQEAGAQFLLPGCGACMNAGPGSSEEGETTISDTNRNFYGRMGAGETYLASAIIVAESALAGKITASA